MTASVWLVAIGLVLGLVGPRILTTQAWMTTAPRLGLTVWLAILWSSISSLSVGIFLLSMDSWLARDMLADVIQLCWSTFHHHYGAHPALSVAALGAVLAVITTVVARVVLVQLRGWMFRLRHRRMLDIVAHPYAHGPISVIDHKALTAYCLPGKGGRIVISSGALTTLNSGELAAVIAHERAHLVGRHHAILAVVRAMRTALPFLPITRSGPQVVRGLLERLADEDACLHHDPEVLARALERMTSPVHVPARALEMVECPPIARLQRLRSRASGPTQPRRVLAMAVTSMIVATPVVLAISPALDMASLTTHCELLPASPPSLTATA